ncbi:MAG: hypothetical protein AAF797_08940 [Planctomycetota bacterium]
MAKESARDFVERWKKLGPILEEQREKDIRATNTARDLEAFDGVMEHALRASPPKPISGLIELHRWLRPGSEPESNP